MTTELGNIVRCENGHNYYATEDGVCPECVRTEHRRIQIGGAPVFGEEILPKRQLAGWLVCLEGVAKGQDYSLMEENNFIGRGSGMDVQLKDCPSVSQKNHSCICYDALEKMFFYLPQSGRGIDYINDTPVFEPREIKSGDVLTIGAVHFAFFALCGANFSWEDLQNE